MSAKPMTPRPILRVERVIRSISGRGYWLTSITLSRKWTAVRMVFSSLDRSSTHPAGVFIRWLTRLMEPRLQLS